MSSEAFAQVRAVLVQVPALLDLLGKFLFPLACSFCSGEFLPVCIQGVPHGLDGAYVSVDSSPRGKKTKASGLKKQGRGTKISCRAGIECETPDTYVQPPKHLAYVAC